MSRRRREGRAGARAVGSRAGTCARSCSIRVTNHSAWTVEGEAYGFNAPVVAEFKRRYGVDVCTQPFDREQWRRLQGEYYTWFLRDARALTRRADVNLQLHVNGLMGFDVPGWRRNNVPATFAWDWRRWIEEDLCDSVALKYIPWEFGAQAGTGVAFGEEVMRVARPTWNAWLTKNAELGLGDTGEEPEFPGSVGYCAASGWSVTM